MGGFQENRTNAVDNAVKPSVLVEHLIHRALNFLDAGRIERVDRTTYLSCESFKAGRVAPRECKAGVSGRQHTAEVRADASTGTQHQVDQAGHAKLLDSKLRADAGAGGFGLV